jgi:hypothetical protein
MWVAPVETLRQVFSAATTYAEEGHADPIFFNGTIYNGDPGFWFYPITFLWRTTPIVLLGLILALVGLLLKGWSVSATSDEKPQARLSISPRVTLLLLLALALLFTLFMNLGAKKFDRYLLPVYPVLDLVAGLGFVYTGQWLRRRWSNPTWQWGLAGLTALLLAGQGALALPHYPYYLTYYNPLLGGGPAAPAVMQIGRGEGADLAARYLNDLTANREPQTLTAASSFPNGPFSYFFRGRTVPPTYWLQADYAVVYPQDRQRLLPSARQISWFDGLTPLTKIHLHGIDYADIFDLAGAPLPPFVTTWAQEATPQIRLNSYELTAGVVQPGEDIHPILYFENLAPIAADLNVLVRLVGADGAEIARDEGWPWGAATSGWTVGDIWPDGYTLTLPATTPPGYYRLEVGFYEPSSQAPLRATQAISGAALPDWVPLDYIQVGPLPQEPAMPLAQPYHVGELATLLGYSTTTSAGRRIDINRVPLLPGEDLLLTLFWQVDRSAATDYTTFIHVLDRNGVMLTQQDSQPVRGLLPTSFWHPRQTVVDTYTLTIPAGAALGQYAIQLGLYELANGARLPIAQENVVIGDTIPLTRLVVALSRMEELGAGEDN